VNYRSVKKEGNVEYRRVRRKFPASSSTSLAAAHSSTAVAGRNGDLWNFTEQAAVQEIIAIELIYSLQQNYDDWTVALFTEVVPF